MHGVGWEGGEFPRSGGVERFSIQLCGTERKARDSIDAWESGYGSGCLQAALTS